VDALYYFPANDAAVVAHGAVAHFGPLRIEQAALLNRANNEAGFVDFGHANHFDIGGAQLGDCCGVGGGGHGVLLFVDGSKIRKRIEPATPHPKNVTNG
jgi:hypothetical protein